MGRLVQIEVENFKSYRGSQVIGPFNNFTSVIGPNGSGKSNLMDAISFVLGVKSNQLRSSQAKELIYRPTSLINASNSGVDIEFPTSASVTAVYDDDDNNEIRFTRTVNSQGTSVYKLNGRPASYSKYNQILERQNILVKAKNFLVFQGDVEAIASQSPQGLTKMIEEISGSMALKPEYDRLKELQEKATENSAHTFSKRRGINQEMKQFKEQKEETDRYNVLTERHIELVAEHLLWKLFHIGKTIEDTTVHITDEQATIEYSVEVLSKLEASIKEVKRRQAGEARNLLKLQNSLATQMKVIEDRKPELAKLNEKISYSYKNLSKAEMNLNNQKQEFDNENKMLTQLKTSLGQLDRSLKNFKAEAKKRSELQGMVLEGENLAEYSRLKADVATRTFEARQQLETANMKLKTMKDKYASEEDSLQRLLVKKQNMEVRHETFLKRKSQQTSELEEVTKEHAMLVTRLQQIREDKNKSEIVQVELKEKLRESQNKLRIAASHRQETRKEQEMKTVLSSLKQAFPGVYGRISGLCRPVQQKFERAITIVLAKHIDSIVVDTEATAIDCIKYLREGRLGSATFLPLDTIDVYPVNERLRQISGVRLAVDVLQFEDVYARAISFVCGNTVVCDDFKTAQKITYDMFKDVKSVALDGTVIHKDGMITGGKTDDENNRGRRWDDKDVDELKKTQTSLLEQLDELSKKIDTDFAETEMVTNISAAETKIDSLKNLIVEVEHEISDCEKESNAITNDWKTLSVFHENNKSRINPLEEEISGLEMEINTVEDEVFEDLCSRIGVSTIREYEQRQGKVTREVAEKTMQFETQKIKVQNQIEFMKGKLSTIENKMEELKSTIKEDKQIIKDLERERDEVVANNEATALKAQEIQTKIDEFKTKIEEIKQEINGLDKEYEETNAKLDSQRKSVNGLQNTIERCYLERYTIFRKCKLEGIEIPLVSNSLTDIPLVDIDELVRVNADDNMDVEPRSGRPTSQQRQSQLSQMDNLLKVDYSKLPRQAKNDGSEEKEQDYKNTISQVMIEMVQLAPNVKAGDKLNEVEEKLRETTRDFERSRREAREAKELFASVRKQRYELFYGAYNHIVKHIDPIYKELTKSRAVPLGGTAYLSLEDSIEPYNAGVKYHAMPPMKRFQDMGLLSGGEKTVAALALLFAIHSYKPSPFFVLDEIDAALDNTNVTKVSNYISKNASDDFQFIVISLKNLFYERAERLVGIYRDQDERSSKILTLDLKDRFVEE